MNRLDYKPWLTGPIFKGSEGNCSHAAPWTLKVLAVAFFNRVAKFNTVSVFYFLI